jgi:hypothetical protein
MTTIEMKTTMQTKMMQTILDTERSGPKTKTKNVTQEESSGFISLYGVWCLQSS